MGAIHNSNDRASHLREICIILRVFDIKSNRPGMYVYFEPPGREIEVGGWVGLHWGDMVCCSGAVNFTSVE